jgi:hypothetical protein
VELTGWFAIAARGGHARCRRDRLNRELDKILKSPAKPNSACRARLLHRDTPEGRAVFVRGQYELWGKVTREIGLEPK